MASVPRLDPVAGARVWFARHCQFGYRFGISDQAFYIPAIDLWRWPDLFPRDRVLLEPQARRTVIDEALGWICRATGLSLELVSSSPTPARS